MSVVDLKPTGREPDWVAEISRDEVDGSECWWSRTHTVCDAEARLCRSMILTRDGLTIGGPDTIFIGGYEFQISEARDVAAMLLDLCDQSESS